MKPSTKAGILRGAMYFTIGYHAVELVRVVRDVLTLDHVATSPAPAAVEVHPRLRWHGFVEQPSGDTWNRPECGLCGLERDHPVHDGTPACPLCADSHVHTHSPLEIICYRNGLKRGT
jgi:hypothetical protein